MPRCLALSCLASVTPSLPSFHPHPPRLPFPLLFHQPSLSFTHTDLLPFSPLLPAFISLFVSPHPPCLPSLFHHSSLSTLVPSLLLSFSLPFSSLPPYLTPTFLPFPSFLPASIPPSSPHTYLHLFLPPFPASFPSFFPHSLASHGTASTLPYSCLQTFPCSFSPSPFLTLLFLSSCL